jgi:hypothetical protein
MGIVNDLKNAGTMIGATVAELRAGGVHPITVAAALMAEAGALYREAMPHEADRRAAIGHAAEVMITGRPQPIRFPDGG